MSLIIVLTLLLPVQAYSQQVSHSDSLALYDAINVNRKPVINYSIGSIFMFVPHLGSVTGFTVSPSLSVPLSSKWSVKSGIIAGHYYSTLGNLNTEGVMPGTFNVLSLYGSAIYHVNPKLTLYGIGTKRLTNNFSFYSIPKSSYAIGSIYNFGDFSIGLTLQVSKWNNAFGPEPFNGYNGLNSRYGQGPGMLPAY